MKRSLCNFAARLSRPSATRTVGTCARLAPSTRSIIRRHTGSTTTRQSSASPRSSASSATCAPRCSRTTRRTAVPIGVAGAVTLGAAALGAGATVYAADKNANTMKSSMSQSPELTGATNSALAQGEQIAQRTYTPYEAQRYAGLSPNEQVASGLAQTGGTKAQSFLDKAGNELSGIKDYSSENLRPYIDPYVSSVLTPELEQENIRYEGARSALANSKAGAFGGDRSALEATGMERTHGKQIAADVGNVYSAAYTNAQHAFFQDQDKKINAANALDKVGGDVSRLNTQQIQDLMATGGLERALSQAQLDFNYQQFIENRDWSTTNLTPLLNSIAAAKGAQMTTTTTGPQSGIAGEAIGAAATIAGAYFTGRKSTSPAMPDCGPVVDRKSTRLNSSH